MAEAAKVQQFETIQEPNIYLVPEITESETKTREVNEYLKIYDDAATFFAETLEGPIRTKFEFSFDGQELYGRDGRALKPIFEDAIAEAESVVNAKPNLLFELRRRMIELEEYKDMIKMAKDELPNTMIVISDFPEELRASSQDVEGYNTRRKQTFLRVITQTPEGKINIESQSLDLSDRESLEAIYSDFDLNPIDGELLGQRIRANLNEKDQKYLIDKLMGLYDKTLSDKNGSEYYAGRRPVAYENTYKFVCEQSDLLKFFVSKKIENSEAAESLRYNIAAAIEQRFRKHDQKNASNKPWQFSVSRSVNYEIEQAGMLARNEGRTYSGCGLTLGMLKESDTTQQLNELDYGNKANNESSYKFDKKMHCVVCQSPPKKEESQKMCGPCGICKNCDNKLKSKP